MKKEKQQYHYGNLHQVMLNESAKIIQEEGVNKLSVRYLSTKLGVSHNALYRHFNSKSELLSAVASEGFSLLTKGFIKINEKVSDPVKQIKNIGWAYVTFAMENPGYYKLMFGSEIIQESQTKQLKENAYIAYNELVKSITSGIQNGILKSENPLTLANTSWSMIHGFVSLSLTRQFQGYQFLETEPSLLGKNNKMEDNGIEFAFNKVINILIDGLKA